MDNSSHDDGSASHDGSAFQEGNRHSVFPNDIGRQPFVYMSSQYILRVHFRHTLSILEDYLMSATEGRGSATPFRVVILGPDMKPRKIYIILGKVPSSVSAAVQRYKIMSPSARKSADRILHDEYGAQYRGLLALDAVDGGHHLLKSSPPPLTPDEIIGGGISGDAYTDDYTNDSAEEYTTITGGRDPPGYRQHRTKSQPGAISAWYDPDDYEGLADLLVVANRSVSAKSGGGKMTSSKSTTVPKSASKDTLIASTDTLPAPNTPVMVNVSDISGTLEQYPKEWFEDRRSCIAMADLTAPILVTQVGPDLVPRLPESICAVRRAMEIGVKTLPVVIRTTTPAMTSRSIRYMDAKPADERYPGGTRVMRTTVAHGDVVRVSPRTGGALEDDEIEALLNEEIPAEEVVKVAYSTGISPPKNYSGETPVEYITGLSIYPVDKFTELSEKIQLISDIPLYRQHLCWFESGQSKTTYMVSANGTMETDIRAVSTTLRDAKHTQSSAKSASKNERSSKVPAPAQPTVIGLPVNRTLYTKRDIVRVETHDAFKLVGAISTVYIADLAEWLSPVRSQLQDIMRDSYQMDLLYWGFIVLYWPRLTRECFHVYASAETSIAQLYPDLMPAKSALKLRFAEEQLWFEHVAAVNNRVEAFSRGNVTAAVTSAVVSIKNPKVVLNLRNIAEFLRTSPELPEIRVHIQDHPRKYIIRKKHASHTNIQWPSGAIYRTGATIVIRPPDHNIIFMNVGADGTVHVRINAPEEESIGFDEIYKMVITYANPVIARINEMNKYVFMSGSSMVLGAKTNMIFGSLNMCLYWKRVLSTAAFNVLKGAFDRLMRAGITQPRAIQQADKHELMFCKAMHWFDATSLDRIMMVVGGQPLMNQYAYMSVANVKQKMDHSYSGRVVRIGHRTTDVRFEIIDIREDEFRFLSHNVSTILYDVANELKVNPTAPPRSQKRLRKLREEDPDLFNLKKYGSKKVYSILCQNTRQPVIYTPDEVAAMDPAARKRLVKYINFTKKSPAYYACPSSVYPNLGFLVGAHPKGLCLPCCNKRVQTGKRTEIYEHCSSCGKWSGKTPGDSSRHIMSYSKTTDIGRLSKLPATIYSVLNPSGSGHQRGRKRADKTDDISGINTSHAHGYYILGVPQTLPGVQDAGFAHACAAAFGLTLTDMITAIIKKVSSGNLFMTARAGQLTSVWDTAADLTETLKDIFIMNKPWSRHQPPQWDNVIFSLVADVFDAGIVYWHDSVVKTAFEYIGRQNPAAYIMIVRRSEYYVPIVQIMHYDYSRTGHIGERDVEGANAAGNSIVASGQYGGKSGGLFSADGPTGTIITSMIKWASSNPTYSLKWMIEKLGEPTAVYVDRYGVSSAAVWNGVYVSMPSGDTAEVPQSILGGILGGILRMDPYNGPAADATAGIALLREILGKTQGEDIAASITVATDCAHIRSGAVGVVVASREVSATSSISWSKLIPGAKVDDGMKTAGISMLDVMKAMHDNTPGADDPSVGGLGKAFYETHQYTLFLVEIVNLLAGERNKVVRGKLAAEIDRIVLPRGIGQLKRSFRNILCSWADDFALIMSMIAAASMTGTVTRAVLHQIIDGEVYEFDNITIAAMKTMDDKVLKKSLLEMAQKFVVEVDKLPEGAEFPNVFNSCTVPRPDGQTAGYCSKRKLMITTPLDGLIDILAADLRNPLKSKYLLNGTWLETTLDWFDFHHEDDEQVVVYRT